ncbi:MAG: cytochrome c3 family protein [Herpetosiphonaceae bacterium]|nr:cytochrome c3 family protein [Herpetosiphonaceae bacterium]
MSDEQQSLPSHVQIDEQPLQRQQLFHPRANTVAKVSIIGGLLAVALAFFLWGVYTRSPYYTGATVTVDQPVPFSHKHHVGELGIDCRMCHTSVEQSASAGMPATQTCMTCHSQIWANSPVLAPVHESFRSGVPIAWNRVYELPGYVYFNHSIHVQKGIGCVSCHGQIDEMPLTAKAVPLTMQWCLNCHRAPEKYIRPRDEVFNTRWVAQDQLTQGRKLVDDYHIVAGGRLTNCSICHR